MTRMTPAEVTAHKLRFNQPRNKYGAKRVQVDGYNFDSKAEAKRYGILKLMKAAGLVTNLEIHPRFFIPPRETGDYDNLDDICIVELDFMYWDEKKFDMIYEDVKGMDNPLSKLKRRLVESFYCLKVQVIR